MSKPSHYYDRQRVADQIDSGNHRNIIGGMWEEIGELQLQTMMHCGLKPEHRLLDIGCGCLRGGVHFVRFLEADHYCGIDLNDDLLEVGYQQELTDAERQKLPRSNLAANGNFDFSIFGEPFDYALALSLFTHLPFNHIRICLERLAGVMKPEGQFLATYFEIEDGRRSFEPKLQEPGGVTSHGAQDPYHYSLADFEWAIRGLPWRVEKVAGFDHPRDQQLLKFVRLPDASMTIASEGARTLSDQEARALPPGALNYRAYVGPPDRFDFMSATQFALLFHLGIREHSKVLDFGCGSLRLGRLLIPFLGAGNYYGIDPNKWLIEDGIARQLGQSIVSLKKPNFAHNDDFSCDQWDMPFDFIMAQSIITHTGPDLMERFFASASQTLSDRGLLLLSYTQASDDHSGRPDNGWHYPHCVFYQPSDIGNALETHGLAHLTLPWFHPGATWVVAARTATALPAEDKLAHLTGSVFGDPQFSASIP